MTQKRVLSVACLLCLILCASTVYAGRTYYLYQPGVETQIDLAKYTATGEIASKNGAGFPGNQKVLPGTAPTPDPSVLV